MPMGTIVTACMLLGLLAALPHTISRQLTAYPTFIRWPVAILVGSAGAWNTFWHGLRNLDNFWGVMALLSGLLMMLVAFYLSNAKGLPRGLSVARPWVLLALFGFMLKYALTIYHL